jgi:hypothetical protein
MLSQDVGLDREGFETGILDLPGKDFACLEPAMNVLMPVIS